MTLFFTSTNHEPKYALYSRVRSASGSYDVLLLVMLGAMCLWIEMSILHCKKLIGAFGMSQAIEALLMTSEGDMRKAITYLQSCARLRPAATIGKEDVCEIAGVIDDGVICELIDVCRSNSYERLETCVQVCCTTVCYPLNRIVCLC